MKKPYKLKKIVILIVILTLGQLPFVLGQVFHKNKGESISKGEVHKGSLVNGYKLPYSEKNFKYFSFFSYYILGRAYVHQNVYNIIKQSYARCEKELGNIKFRYMECSTKKGGRMWPHRTHQNGLSIDFMSPIKKHNKQIKRYDHTGIFHYAMRFDEHGRLKMDSDVTIDFETMAKHILILDETARKNGMKIKKVILKLDLKDDLYKTKWGKEIKKRGIYLATRLPEKVDNMHDDHYHVDFEFLK